jgi:hypothetical protein
MLSDIGVTGWRAVRHWTNVWPGVHLVLHAAVAGGAVVRHWTNIRTAVNTSTVAALLFANIAIIAARGMHVGSCGNVFGRNFVTTVLPRILVRHGANIRTGEYLLLATLLVSRVSIAAIRILVRHRANIRTGEHLLLATLLVSRVGIAAVRILMRHRVNIRSGEYLLFTARIAV